MVLCKNCDKPIRHGDTVRAEILTVFVGLKSKVAYALERPKECTWIQHKECWNPKSNTGD